MTDKKGRGHFRKGGKGEEVGNHSEIDREQIFQFEKILPFFSRPTYVYRKCDSSVEFMCKECFGND
jgi:hypothetical protein